jgi:hypothetical protein
VESLAGYSILTYILQVKDRHNGGAPQLDHGLTPYLEVYQGVLGIY